MRGSASAGMWGVGIERAGLPSQRGSESRRGVSRGALGGQHLKPGSWPFPSAHGSQRSRTCAPQALDPGWRVVPGPNLGCRNRPALSFWFDDGVPGKPLPRGQLHI